MDHYYGVVRSDSNTLSHYGVKGMRWGVRKAIKSGDKRKIYKQYEKAENKYAKLIAKADMTKAANNAYAHRAIARGAAGITGIQSGLSGALIAQNGLKKAWPIATFFTGPAAAITGMAAINYKKNKNRLTAKGHKKAIKNIRNWESEMEKAFKGTVYEKSTKGDKYDDTYEIRDLVKGKNGYHEKTIAKIKGDYLTSDYHGKDKDRFFKIAGKGVSYLKKGKNDKAPSFTDRMIAINRKQHNINSTSDADPMAFNYNYYNLHKKRKDKKIPYYMSSKEAYNSYLHGNNK